MFQFKDDVTDYRCEFVACFGKERMSFYSLDDLNSYVASFCAAFPDFDLSNLFVYKVHVFNPIKPNNNA